MNLPNVEQQPAPISTNQQRRFEKEWRDIGKFCFDTLQVSPGFLQHPGISTIIELDDGKILTGKPDQFDGKNHGFL